MFDFEKEEKNMKRFFWVALVFNMILAVAFMIGLGWVVFKVMQYFGII